MGLSDLLPGHDAAPESPAQAQAASSPAPPAPAPAPASSGPENPFAPPQTAADPQAQPPPVTQAPEWMRVGSLVIHEHWDHYHPSQPGGANRVRAGVVLFIRPATETEAATAVVAWLDDPSPAIVASELSNLA